MLLSAIRRLSHLPLVLAMLATTVACGAGQPPPPPPGSIDADRYLFDQGSAELAEGHWIQAREYFRRLVDTYPQSPHRADAKLGIGDSYLGENRLESRILAANEYREFLQFFPTHERADYAQYQIIQSYAGQMRSPRRDQSPTRDAKTEVDRFLRNYPNSDLRPEVEALQREVLDRLAEYEYRVGLFYHRQRNWLGAMMRFDYVRENYPNYTRMDEVYFQIAETIFKAGSPADSAQFYERVINEYPDSPHVEEATKRLAEIKR